MTDNNSRHNLSFGNFLRFWRQVHHLNQEQLADLLGSSARHISRLENGRVHPSLEMVVNICQTLALNNRDSNHLLISAGYIPRNPQEDVHASKYRWLRHAMKRTLRALDPYPSALLDSVGNLLLVNRAWVGFYAQVVGQHRLQVAVNHFDLLFDIYAKLPQDERWQDAISLILMNMQQQVLLTNNLALKAKLDQLSNRREIPSDWAQRAAKLEPMASFRLQLPLGDNDLQYFFSVSQTAGATGPAAYASEPRLTVNTLHPENENLDMHRFAETELSHPLAC